MNWPWRKRLVVLHMAGPSIEGFLVGFWANHYVLRAAQLRETADRTVAFEGAEVRVPREKVEVVEVVR